MARLEHELAQIDSRVAALKARFEQCTQEGARLRMELEKATETIAAAEGLIGKLVGERERWESQSGALSEAIARLPTQSLLAAAFMAYLPPASEDDRAQLMDNWRALVNDDGQHPFDFLNFMVSESQQLSWRASGLPADKQCLENAVAVLETPRAPLLVDPASSADAWLRSTLAGTRLEVVTMGDAGFTTALELAIRFGKTLLVQEVDTIEPILYPVLRRDLVAQGPRFCVQVGEKMIDYVDDFRLYMTTRSAAPQIPPDADALVTRVNFTVTRAGLVGQLLARAIVAEQPELEVKKTELVREEEQMKLSLAELEEALLRELAAAQGNILENKTLLDSLNETKAKASVIAESLATSSALQASLDVQRNVYHPLAETGSRLFFVIRDLAKINNMYAFSLAGFLALFDRALAVPSDGSSDTSLRAALLGNALQSLAYASVCRSLFKADRLMFAMHLVHGMRGDSAFGEEEWALFTGTLAGVGAFRRKDSVERLHAQVPSWVPRERASDAATLAAHLPRLSEALGLRDADTWAGWARSARCEEEFPEAVRRRLEPFQQVLVVQALRPDRLQSAMTKFARDSLGLRQLSPPTESLRRLYEEDSSAAQPILLLVAPGTDPSHELAGLAADVVGASRLHEVAMGQGQSEVAEALLTRCARDGDWLVLKNVHLVTPWLSRLDALLQVLVDPAPGFRIWLTTEPHPSFPATLLQKSLKVAVEAPPGIRMNLIRTYESWTPEFVSAGTSLRARSLFALAWLHAVLQERRNFVPQGWTKAYEFSAADLRASASVLSRVCEDAAQRGGVPRWEDIHGLMASALYGGRVDNRFDVRVLRTYVERIFSQAMLPTSGRAQDRLVGGLTLPTSTHHADYVAAIKGLPEVDAPEMFGLPDNVDRSAQRHISRRVIDQLKVLARPDALMSAFNREAWFRELSPLLQLWRRLTEGGDLLREAADASATAAAAAAAAAATTVDGSGRSKSSKTSTASPLTAFVALERQNALAWVQQVNTELSALGQVIKGTALLTPQLMALGRALLLRQTPPSWIKQWDGPEDPAAWARALVSRALALRDWTEAAARGALTTRPVNLGELFHPDTFLNALRQETSRVLGVPMDTLVFACSWGTEGLSSAVRPVTLDGLQLEGCTFDRARLSAAARDAPSVSASPPCTVAWVQPQEAPSNADTISLPLYETAQRETVVATLDVPAGGNSNKWVLAGAAFFIGGL